MTDRARRAALAEVFRRRMNGEYADESEAVHRRRGIDPMTCSDFHCRKARAEADLLMPLVATWAQEDYRRGRMDGLGSVESACIECGGPVDRSLPESIPEGHECMMSEALAGRALYCRACYGEAR